MQVEELIGQLQTFAEASGGKKGDEILQEAAQQVADELVALQSIFGSENISQVQGNDTKACFSWRPDQTIHINISVSMDLGDDILSVKISATLPSGYPQLARPPQLQLLSRYIGSHGVDHILFGQILRAFHQGSSDGDHSIFQPGQVALFDGIEKVRENIEEWYSEREAEVLQRKEGDLMHHQKEQESSSKEVTKKVDQENSPSLSSVGIELESNIKIYSSEALTERKSVFVGHAVVLNDVSEVPHILSIIMKDKKVARATHPAIYAWVFRPEGEATIHRDCHDDGETAAGGRLAHLLNLLHLENVFIAVTRWYGSVQLGADRFKMINRAAREALELAQLVARPSESKS